MSEEETSSDTNTKEEGSESPEADKKSDSPENEVNNDRTSRQGSSEEVRSRNSDQRQGPPPTKLYVGNLPDSCKRSELQELFEKYGKVEKCDILRNYAFVHFEKQTDAVKATENLDDAEFMGVHIQVQQAKSKGRPTAGENECFECGKAGHWARDCPRRRGFRRPPPRSGYYPGPDYYQGPDGYRGRDHYRDSYSYDYPSYRSRYGVASRSSGYSSPYSSAYAYSGSRARSRSPPRSSYHSAYAYPPRRAYY